MDLQCNNALYINQSEKIMNAKTNNNANATNATNATNTVAQQVAAIVGSGKDYAARLKLAKAAATAFAGGELSALTLRDALKGASYEEWESLRQGWLAAYAATRKRAGCAPLGDDAARKAWSRAVAETKLDKPAAPSKGAAAKRGSRAGAAKVETAAGLAERITAMAEKDGVDPRHVADDEVRRRREKAVTKEDATRLAVAMAAAEKVKERLAKAAEKAAKAAPPEIRDGLAEWLENIAGLIRSGKGDPSIVARLRAAFEAATEKAKAA